MFQNFENSLFCIKLFILGGDSSGFLRGCWPRIIVSTKSKQLFSLYSFIFLLTLYLGVTN